MATKKSAKKKTKVTKASNSQTYSVFVQGLIGLLVILSFVFLAMAYWRYA